MKENKYDDPVFFEKYSRMDRSQQGLEGAGEWHILKKMMPDFVGKRVMDLGCGFGFGWHCRYAAEHGARSVVGIDISEKMIAEALRINKLPEIEYRVMPVEEIDYGKNTFDIVFSSLTFHYIESFGDMVARIDHCLISGGAFVFSAEHPVFTAYGNQDWYYDEAGNRLHWPVDHYFSEGKRESVFLGEKTMKYHKTLTTYINTLLKHGFEIRELIEAQPSEEALRMIPEMKEELRRPMMLLISALKR